MAIERDTTLNSDSDGIFIRGRRIFMNLAVDKDTASTLTLDKKSDQGKQMGKDRRNMYLKGEGRVDNNDENNLWDQLPEQDKLKRQKAWSEKNTKLKSPLFLISPTRLSIRNIAKDVDERSLKKLCVLAVERGMQKNLVTAEDQIKHWRAAGEMTTREILEKVDSFQHKDDILPEFDDKNIRKFIPSVFIERDFSSNKKDGAPSRGFGFVEFTHHIHALACLRELNNNTAYTEDYVSGGRQAMIQKSRKVKKKRKTGEEAQVKVPRLIVEFVVENRAKAKKQAEHQAHQIANSIKQRLEHKENAGGVEQKKEKKSRGQRQRERKRKERESGSANSSNKPPTSNEIPVNSAKRSAPDDGTTPVPTTGTTKPKKPSKKKRKVDPEEEKLSKLVDSYESSIAPAPAKVEVTKGEDNPRKRVAKRWYEE
jgi:nucleolar protein 4